MNCEDAHSLISSSAIITGCDSGPEGILRIQTKFEYPGNEFVDVFVRACAPGAPLELTDAGMTVAQLLGFGLDLDATERRRQFVRTVCSQLGIRRDSGELVATVAEPVQQHFGPTVVRLAQACVRIADLIVTHQSRISSTFSDEIEEGLDAIRVPFEAGARLRGAQGRDVTVDYLIHTPRLPMALLGVSARTPGSAQNQVNATLRKWIELANHRGDHQFVTLLDSRVALWRDSDRGVLEDVSQVFEYPAEANAFRELVTNE